MCWCSSVCLSVWLVCWPWQSAWRNLLWKLMLGFHLDPRTSFISSLQYCWMSYTKPHSLNIYSDSIWYINLQRLYLVPPPKKKLMSDPGVVKNMVNIWITLEITNTVRNSRFCFYPSKNKSLIKNLSNP